MPAWLAHLHSQVCSCLWCERFVPITERLIRRDSRGELRPSVITWIRPTNWATWSKLEHGRLVVELQKRRDRRAHFKVQVRTPHMHTLRVRPKNSCGISLPTDINHSVAENTRMTLTGVTPRTLCQAPHPPRRQRIHSRSFPSAAGAGCEKEAVPMGGKAQLTMATRLPNQGRKGADVALHWWHRS